MGDPDLVLLGQPVSRSLCGDQFDVCRFSPQVACHRIVDGDHRFMRQALIKAACHLPSLLLTPMDGGGFRPSLTGCPRR
jgi:hypothetical protein